MTGGACTGAIIVDTFFYEQAWGGCMDCHMRTEDVTCQVLDGLEPASKCPEWQEHVRYHEIKVTK